MAKSKKTDEVQLRAKPGKTIHRGIRPGTPGDKNKSIPPKAPVTQIIQPKAIFVVDADEAERLIKAGAATLVSDEKKTKTAQELTDESAEAAGATTAGTGGADEAATKAAEEAAAKLAEEEAAKNAPTLPGAKT